MPSHTKAERKKKDSEQRKRDQAHNSALVQATDAQAMSKVSLDIMKKSHAELDRKSRLRGRNSTKKK